MGMYLNYQIKTKDEAIEDMNEECDGSMEE